MIGSMNRQLVYAFAVSMLLLTGCAGSSAPAATTAAPAPTTAAVETTAAETEAETEAESEPESIVETEEEDVPPAAGLVRSPITYEWIPEDLAKKRPIAVMYPTDKKAQPQYGLDRVGVFYEIMEEGSMSRQMGVLEDWEGLERIGNIRSVRDYFIYEALEWDAILVHFGGPEVFVKDMLTRPDVDNLNGVDGAMGSSYGAFYRVPAGTNSVHSAFTDSDHILKAIEKAGFERNYREEYYDPVRWKFAKESAPTDLSKAEGSREAKVLNMKGCYPITGSELTYNEKDGLYYRSIYGAPQKDAVTGEQLSFSNVIIESVTSGVRGGQYLYFNVLDRGHEGYYATGGKMIHITWGKTNEYETTKFYDDNGEELKLNVGRTMIFIARTGQDSFTVDGEKIEL